ncbi:IS3 family transposase [Streptomyces griseobrunneus]
MCRRPSAPLRREAALQHPSASAARASTTGAGQPRTGPPGRRPTRGLAARIRAVHQESDGTCRAPGITAELRETSGEALNHKRVARVMRASGTEGVRLRRAHRTTVPDPAAAKAPDLIGRDFTAGKPNTKYVGDITHLPIDGGKFCYLATVIDLASRRLAGWAIADHMRADLVTDALAGALRTRGSLAGSIMHTDDGAQYTSRAFAEACRSAGARRSMSAVGSSADNALAESFNATFKRETLQRTKELANRARGPTRRLPMAPPLQHPAPTLPPRTTITDRLRRHLPPHTNYAGTNRITRVQDSRSRPLLVRDTGAHVALELSRTPPAEVPKQRDQSFTFTAVFARTSWRNRSLRGASHGCPPLAVRLDQPKQPCRVWWVALASRLLRTGRLGIPRRTVAGGVKL